MVAPSEEVRMPATLADRVRSLLAGRTVREVRMFGGLSFMVDGRLTVAVRGDDALLVHIDPARFDELIRRPGARQAVMGDRTMGPGWLSVAGELSDDELRSWLDVALSSAPG
jgi:hypothetical protein